MIAHTDRCVQKVPWKISVEVKTLRYASIKSNHTSTDPEHMFNHTFLGSSWKSHSHLHRNMCECHVVTYRNDWTKIRGRLYAMMMDAAFFKLDSEKAPLWKLLPRLFPSFGIAWQVKRCSKFRARMHVPSASFALSHNNFWYRPFPSI